jgi:hypothetical protein
MGFKALEEAGFADIDTKLTGTVLSSRVLPVSKECLATCLADVDVCIILMAQLSASFLELFELTALKDGSEQHGGVNIFFGFFHGTIG